MPRTKNRRKAKSSPRLPPSIQPKLCAVLLRSSYSLLKTLVRAFGKAIGFSYALTISVSVFLTIVAAVAVFLPRVTVDPAGFSDPAQSSFLTFTLTNTGIIPLTNVQPVFYPCNIYMRNPMNAPPPAVRPLTRCAGPFKDGFEPPAWHAKVLAVDEKQTLRFDDYVNTRYAIVEYADIAIGVKYQPWFLPFIREKQFRFVTRKEPDGKLSWISQPLEK
jgi:hypothetical protein